MTEKEKIESKQAEESSESTVSASGNNNASKSPESPDTPASPPPSPTVSEKVEEPSKGESGPEISVAATVASNIEDDEKSVRAESSSCCGHDEEPKPQGHVPMYVGLSILFILLLFYYNLTKTKEQALQITSIGNNVSEIGSRIGGLDQQISGFEKSLTKYEQSILGLELKRSLVTVEEIITRGNEKTLNAAIRAKTALRSLINSMTTSSAASRYRVKQISPEQPEKRS